MHNHDPFNDNPDIEQVQERPPQQAKPPFTTWLLWLLESAIAIALALLIWLDLWGPSGLKLILPSLAAVALYAAIKTLAVLPWFKQVDYVNLYAAFAAGLWLYRRLLGHLPLDGWLAYSWIPFLLLAPVLLILNWPPAGLWLNRLKFGNLTRYLSGLAVYGVRPFLVLYTLLHGVLHPHPTILYLVKRPARIVTAIILVGLFAAVVATVYIPLELAPQVSWVVLLWAVIPLVVWTLTAITWMGRRMGSLSSGPLSATGDLQGQRALIGMISVTTTLIGYFAEGTRDQ
jgi:hypothetical protein